MYCAPKRATSVRFLLTANNIGQHLNGYWVFLCRVNLALNECLVCSVNISTGEIYAQAWARPPLLVPYRPFEGAFLTALAPAVCSRLFGGSLSFCDCVQFVYSPPVLHEFALGSPVSSHNQTHTHNVSLGGETLTDSRYVCPPVHAALCTFKLFKKILVNVHIPDQKTS